MYDDLISLHIYQSYDDFNKHFRGNMRPRSSGVKSKKKKSENEDEAGKSGNGTEKCEEKLVKDLDLKAERVADEEESGQGEGDELRDEESVESQESVGPFIRPGNRRFRRTGEVRERLAKLKARAIETVLDEVDMEAEKKNMAILKVELVEQLSRVYGEELWRMDVADPNKARYNFFLITNSDLK